MKESPWCVLASILALLFSLVAFCRSNATHLPEHGVFKTLTVESVNAKGERHTFATDGRRLTLTVPQNETDRIGGIRELTYEDLPSVRQVSHEER